MSGTTGSGRWEGEKMAVHTNRVESSSSKPAGPDVTKGIDAFLDRFIEAVILSIPIFILVLALWSHGFEFLVGGTAIPYYLPIGAYNFFGYQIYLALISLMLAIIARVIPYPWKVGALVISLVLYFLSIVFLAVWLGTPIPV